MSVRLAIGDFSTMTYLSIKALRRYHEMGLLVPAAVDPVTGYRYYEAAQVPVGQVIRRFRDLQMPLEEIKEVLDAPDGRVRNELIVVHLRRMEGALEHTQRTVGALRSLLERGEAGTLAVEYRTVPDTRALSITEPVAMADVEAWWEAAFEELHRIVGPSAAARGGPDGALYPREFFQNELAEVTAFVPVTDEVRPAGRAQLVQVKGAELAVTVHEGAFSELDQAYGALGTFVADQEIAVEGPIREHYLVSYADTDDESAHRTEVCWPVFHTRQSGDRRDHVSGRPRSEEMATIVATAQIETGAEECWEALRDFGALHHLAPGFITECRLVEPEVRQVTFSSGAIATERLVGIDEDAMRLAYTVIEGPMGSVHHNASAQVTPLGRGRCRFVWITDVLPDQLAARTRALMDAGLQAIRQHLERSPSAR